MTEHPTPYEALIEATERAGSQAKLATIAGVSTTAVWKWVQSTKQVKAECVLRIEAATGVSRHDLRPDIYPREPETPSKRAADHGLTDWDLGEYGNSRAVLDGAYPQGLA